MKNPTSHFAKIALQAAHKAGEVLRKNFGGKNKITYKGEINLVTEIDRRSERVIVDHLHKNFKSHAILTEEEYSLHKNSEFRWLVDPLDGTTNYAHGFPVFCVSIALMKGDELILGVVCQPLLEELFLAEKNSGAWLNKKRIRVSNSSQLRRSLLATGFPYDIRTSRNNNLNHFKNFALRAQAVRRAGAAALDLAYTAAGRFDGFWEFKLNPWDLAAGVLLVEEAGGKVTDYSGQPYDVFAGEILASNGKIHRQMEKVLKRKT
ncbi:MAG: inositol monophosphatase [candidate division Zixibacteria bacterium]|nr:inositol monophosphatase [candidate division Zixibacteria bacterium]